MNDDELDAAREAVAATRTWRDQMRADWGYHREPEEILDEAVGELLAERDRLRAVVDAARPVLRQVTDSLRDADSGGPLDAWALADVTAHLCRSLAGAIDDRVQLDVSPTGEGT